MLFRHSEVDLLMYLDQLYHQSVQEFKVTNCYTFSKIFWQKKCFLVLESFYGSHTCSVSFFWNMDTDLNWIRWDMQCFICSYGLFCDLLDELLTCSWCNFGWVARLVGNLSLFSLWIISIIVFRSCWKVSEIGFATLWRLIKVNVFVSYLFFNFVRLDVDVFWSELF